MKRLLAAIALAILTADVLAVSPAGQGTFKLKSGVETSYEVFSHPRYLQFRIRCSEPEMKQLKCEGNVHDVSVWRGDSLELFIKPSKTSATIAHFAVSPNGSMYDSIVRDMNRIPSWTPAGIEVKTDRGADFWSVDLKIPTALLIGMLPDDKARKGCGPDSWSFNIVRNRRAGQHEMISCAPCNFWLQHEKYLKLTNVQTDYPAFRWNISGLKISKLLRQGNKFSAFLEGTVDNVGGRMKLITVAARLTDQKKSLTVPLSEQKLALAKGQMFRLHETVELPRCGEFLLEVELSDGQGMLGCQFTPVKLEFVPIRLSIISGAFRGRDIFATMPAKSLVFRIQTDYPVRPEDTCELVIRDADKKVIVRKNLSAKEAIRGNIRIDLPHRQPGKYVCEAKLSTKGLPPASAVLRILPPAENEIYLAENGNFVRNGKEFFPIGGYGHLGKFVPPEFEKISVFSVNYGPVRPKTPRSKAIYEQPFEKYGSRSMPYPEPPELWSHPVSPVHAKRALRPLPPAAAKRIGEVISGWKGSNSIFGWYLVDEPSESKCLPEYYDQVAAVCHEHDPYHMTFMVFNSADAARTYGKSCDAVIFDYFPEFHEKGRNKPLDHIVRMAEKTVQGLGPGKSLISAPPLYAYVDNSTLLPRYATYEEMRCMVYSSLTNDAVRGICWNESSRMGVCLDHYIGVPRISRNLKALEKFWLSRDLVKLTLTGKDAPKVQWLAKKVNGKLYALLVNPTDRKLRVDLKLPDGSGELYELDKEIPQSLLPGAENVLAFEPLQVRIFSADPEAPKLIIPAQVRKMMQDFEAKELESGNLCYYKRGAETIHSLAYVKDSKSFRAPANRRMVNDGLDTWIYNVRPLPKDDPDPYLGIRFKNPEKVSRIEIYWHPLTGKTPDASKLILEGADGSGQWKPLSVTGCETKKTGEVVRAVFSIRPAKLKQFRVRFTVKDTLQMSICELKAFK